MVCTKCKIDKKLNEFYKRSDTNKLRSRCKSCMSEDRIAYNKSEKGVNNRRDRYLRDKEAHKLRVKKYEQSEKGKQALFKKYLNAKKVGRIDAYNKIRKLERNGELAKTNYCSICNEFTNTQFHHHNGYTGKNAIDVVEVCAPCHGKEHRNALLSVRL